jgi:hypothetical protein
VREDKEANRTRVAGHLEEIQRGVANALNSCLNGAVGFIDWLGLAACGIGESIDSHRTLYTMQLALNLGHHLEAARFQNLA